jgi:uncharacterized membrane protein
MPISPIWIEYMSWSASEKIAIAILVVLTIGYISFFSAFQIQRQKAFENSLDTFSVEQPIWNTLHGSFLRATYYPVTGETVSDFNNRKTDSLLGDHVQPSLLVLLIPYALLPRTETLLILLCFCVGAGAIPMYRIAKRRVHSPWLALLFAGGYLFLPAIETNTGWDIHGANFLPPLLLASLDAAETGHIKTWWVITLLAMGFREDFPIFVGWAMIFMAPRILRKQAWSMFVIGLIFSLVSFFYIIPHFGGGGTPYIVRFFPPGTPISFQGIWLAVIQPTFWRDDFLRLIVYNLRLGIPLLFLYFASLHSLLAIAPPLLSNSLSWYNLTLSPDIFHYSAPIIPWAIVGAAEGFGKVSMMLKRRLPLINWKVILSFALLTSILTMHFMLGYTPLTRGFIWPDSTGMNDTLQEISKSIPKNAPISVEPHLAAHFSQYKTVYLFPDLRNAQWILLDVWYGSYPFYLPLDDIRKIWNSILTDHNWETVYAGDGFILLKKGYGPPKNVSAAYRLTQPTTQEFVVQYGGKNGIDLVGVNLVNHSKDQFSLCTEWEISRQRPGISPAIQFLSTKNIISDIPDYRLQQSPEPFTQPGIYRFCNRLYASTIADQRAVLISTKTEELGFQQTSILDPGNWSSYLTINNDVLVINLSGLK